MKSNSFKTKRFQSSWKKNDEQIDIRRNRHRDYNARWSKWRKIINKNILIQIQNENLIFIFYWQSCYISLRYSLIFFWNEQNWNKNIVSKNIKIIFNYWLERMNQMLYHDINWQFKHLRFFHEKNNFCIKILTMNVNKINWKTLMTIISMLVLKKKIKKNDSRSFFFLFVYR